MKWLRYKRRWYWTAQLLLWSLFAITQLANYLLFHQVLPSTDAEAERVLVWVGAQTLAGLLMTHVVRFFFVRSGVLSAGLGRQLLVLGVGKLGLSWSFYGVMWVLGHGLTPPTDQFVAMPPVAAVDLRHARPTTDAKSTLNDFRAGLVVGAIQTSAAPLVSLDVRLSHANWSHYTFVWLLGYLLIVAAEHRLGAELEQARAEADLSRTQLELLHQQINPHFLFNTLNSIRALALVDPHRTRTALTQLADLLRYSLRPPGSGQLIPLGEELAAVRDYLALEQTRFGPERLRLDLAVPEDLLAWPVPPAALLTLVENAVKHGLAATPQGGTLGLYATRQGAGLALTVRQPGHLPAPNSQPTGTGLGMANTRQRLRALYGEAAGLVLAESPVGTVTATLQLPFAPRAI